MKKLFLIVCLGLTLPLLAEMNVLVFAGSTRGESYNKMLAHESAELALKMGAKVTVIDLKDYDMPFYNADLESKKGLPKNAKRLRELMIASDAILIASPEYNSSIPGILKNALDWVSRTDKGSPSRDAFKGKKFAIMSASPGKGGGARALVHLRSVIEDIGGIVISKQVSVPKAYEVFDDHGKLENEALIQSLQEEIQELLQKS